MVLDINSDEFRRIEGQSIFPYLTQHFVGIYAEIPNEHSEIMRSAYSGVLVDVDNQPVVVGSGHCFAEIDHFVSRGQRTKRCYLIDPQHPSRGPNQGAVAIDWELSAPYIEVNDTGVDFGAIFLNELAYRNLQANGKIAMVLPADGSSIVPFTHYLMGLPQSRTELTEDYGKFFLALYRLKKLDERPDLTYTPTTEEFYGELDANAGSVAGASGGPVFAVGDDPENKRWVHWLLGIQRAQRGRLVIAPMLKPFLERLRTEIGRRKAARR